jgi:acetylornithine/N-succinyldiaminopimelate aminotransferase
MKRQDVFDAYRDCIMPTYTKTPLVFVKGKGSYLWDMSAERYLDFFPGWGVNNIGHCHPMVLAAVRDQISKLIFVPNNYYLIQQAKLAQEIVYWSYPGKVFFCNSGAEANEAAIKCARAFGKGERYEIISFKNSFHGRTLAALSATGQEKYQKGFAPLVAGFTAVPFNDIAAVRAALTPKTVAIMLELIQGEGGINIADRQFVRDLRSLCDTQNLLLIVDEVQTGMGRTGEMFGCKYFGVTPDLMTLAKSLGGGLPIGALVAHTKVADTLQPGMHASTFGGGPVICKAALAVFKAIQKEKMLANVRIQGEYFLTQLTKLKKKFPVIKEVRGAGLMIALELHVEGKPVVEYCMSQKLLINCTQNKILRLMPALNVTKPQIDRALSIISKGLEKIPEGSL